MKRIRSEKWSRSSAVCRDQRSWSETIINWKMKNMFQQFLIDGFFLSCTNRYVPADRIIIFSIILYANTTWLVLKMGRLKWGHSVLHQNGRQMTVLFPLRLSCSLSSTLLNQINYSRQHTVIGSRTGIFKQSRLAAGVQTRRVWLHCGAIEIL